MENADANQLPEVDSLPDGFVDGPNESLAPLTPTAEQEKPLTNCNEDTISELDHSNERVPDLVAKTSELSLESDGKTEKQRPVPISLCQRDGFVDSVKIVEVPDKAHVERAEAIQGGSDVHATDAKEITSSESTELQKGRKLSQETTESKRKNSKRAFKSEKEFLEFSLKYQQVLSERDAAIAIRDKLESLCRELQRQNKMLMEECKRVSTEGQNLRLDLSAKFQDAIKDVSSKLEEQKEESFSQLKENEMLRNKLKELADQYTLTEQQYGQKLKQKTLELQVADLKIKQHEEKLVQEQAQMKIYAEQVSQLLATEKNLRLQLTADGEKFQQFQDALLKSNEVFETFKQEIEKMAKSIKELKKENVFLKSKSEKSDVTLIELVEERERLKKQLEKTKNQKEKLESLCRSLQAERKLNSMGNNAADVVPTL